MLGSAIVFMNLALILYTVAVWSERKQGVLKVWHLVLFASGLVFDSTGTYIMSVIAENPGFSLNIHGILGALAIFLMLFHTAWAANVLWKKDEKLKKQFHKLSIGVWSIWLVSYVTGIILNMG